MSDPLTDPRAQQLLSTSPGELDGLASFFQNVAGQAQEAATGLQGAHGDATWTGGAATAFRAKLGKLPHDLAGVQQSYGDVAHALRTYSTNVTPIQTQFRSVYTQLQTAQGQMTSAQGTLSNAKGALTSAQNAPKAKPTDPAVKSATTAVSGAQGTVNRLQGEISGLDSRGCHLLDEFDTVRRQCRNAVNRAAGQAPQHHSSLFGDIVHIADDVVKGVVGVAKNLYEHIKDLPAAAVALYEHPSWSNLGRFAEDVGAAATVVALAATVIVAPEALLAGGAEEAAVGAAEGGAAAAEGGAAAAEGGAAAAEGGAGAAEGGAGAAEGGAGAAGEGGAGEAETAGSRFMTAAKGVQSYSSGVAQRAMGVNVVSEVGEGNYKGAAVDAVFAEAHLGDGVGSVLRPGDAAAADEAGETLSSMQSYQAARDAGYSDSAAKTAAFGDDVPESLSGANPSSETIAATIKAQQEAVETAKAPIEDLGHLIDTFGIDPTKEKIKDAVGAGAGA